jgi:hypothetical protein
LRRLAFDQQGSSRMSGSKTPVPASGDLTVQIGAALLFGLATLVVISTTGGSIAVSMTGLIVTVNAPH